MFTRALCIATLAIALGTAFAATGASAQNPSPANRLALVVGEAAYSGDALPTAAADAALVAQSLAAAGFDVTELHDLGAADLASQYQAFVAKVAAAPAGAAVTVYLAGLGVAVGCDDYLLPVDARIATEADAPRVALSMTRVMNDLAQTPSQLRLVMLDGARPIPGSVSAVAFPRGLIPLHPPGATTFGLSAEIHDFEAPPKPGDANDAYAPAFASAAQLPLTDLESVMRETRVIAHQATAGAQTPWQETNPSAPRRPCPGRGGGRGAAELDHVDRRTRPGERLLGRGVAQCHPRLSGLSRRFRRDGDAGAKGDRRKPPEPFAAAQSTMRSERGAASAAADRHRPGLPRRILRPGRLRRCLLRSARPAAGAGLPGRIRLGRH